MLCRFCCTWSHCRNKSPKRRRCSIGRLSAWCQPFTEGLVEGESGTSDSVFHIFQRNKESRKARRQHTTSYTFFGYNYVGSQSSQRRKRIAIASSICGCGTRYGNSVDTELSVQQQDCTRFDDFFKFCSSQQPPKICRGVATHQFHIDPEQVELLKEWSEEKNGTFDSVSPIRTR